jgi:hypothetical protein
MNVTFEPPNPGWLIQGCGYSHETALQLSPIRYQGKFLMRPLMFLPVYHCLVDDDAVSVPIRFLLWSIRK